MPDLDLLRLDADYDWTKAACVINNGATVLGGNTDTRRFIPVRGQNAVPVSVCRALWPIRDVKAVPAGRGQVGKREIVGDLDTQVAGRGFPAHPYAAVLQIPVRGTVFVQRHVLEREIGLSLIHI